MHSPKRRQQTHPASGVGWPARGPTRSGLPRRTAPRGLRCHRTGHGQTWRQQKPWRYGRRACCRCRFRPDASRGFEISVPMCWSRYRPTPTSTVWHHPHPCVGKCCRQRAPAAQVPSHWTHRAMTGHARYLAPVQWQSGLKRSGATEEVGSCGGGVYRVVWGCSMHRPRAVKLQW